MGALLTLALAGPLFATVIKPVPKLQLPISPVPALTQLRLDVALAAGGALLSPNLQLLVAPVARPSPVPGALPVAEGSPLQIDALHRLEIAQQLLSRYEPEKFAQMSDVEREEVLAEVWDGWRQKSLTDDGAAADKIILEGISDKRLTMADKNVFLSAGFLGYPSEKEARAADYAARIARHVKAGQIGLPVSLFFSPDSAMAFADLVKELLETDDFAAVGYLTSGDPALAAFLLDASKPGHHLHDADERLVSRILRTRAVKNMGLRTLKKPDEDSPNLFATYVYRPHRVAQRLSSISADAPQGALLAAYGRSLSSVARDAGKGSSRRWVFSDYPPEDLTAYPATGAGPRWELPAFPGKRPGILSEDGWRGLRALKLGSAVILVTDAQKTQGKVAAQGVIQVAALEELGRRTGKDRVLLASLIRALLG
jgi:hypothetical protein